MFDFHVDVFGDYMIGITHFQIAATHGRTLSRLDNGGTNVSGGFVVGDFAQLQPGELFAFRPGLAGRVCTGAVFVDEFLQLFLFRQHGCVDALVVFASLLLKFQKRVDLAGIQRQFAT